MIYLENRRILFALLSLILCLGSFLVMGEFLLTPVLATVFLASCYVLDLPWVKTNIDEDHREGAEWGVPLVAAVLWALMPWVAEGLHVPWLVLLVMAWTAAVINFTQLPLDKTAYVAAPPLISLFFIFVSKSPVLLKTNHPVLLAFLLAVVAGFFVAAMKIWIANLIEKKKKVEKTPLPASLSKQIEKTEVAQKEAIELREQVKKLQVDLSAAEMAKMEFLATMSHEIRTPLNGIVPLLDIVMDTKLDDFQQDYLTTAHTSATQMQKLIDDLLDFSKVEAGKLTVEITGIKVKKVIEEVAANLGPVAENKGLELVVNYDENISPLLRGDPIRVRQVLTNLVSNAIKFTDEGTVTIAAKKIRNFTTKEAVRFSVKDEGMGIPRDQLGKLFTAFTQADNSSTRKFGGTGLGLAISHKIVELLKGTMGVESEVDQGSHFWFDLELSKSQGDALNPGTDISYHQAVILNTNPILCRRIQAELDKNHIKSQTSLNLDHALARVKAAGEIQDQKQMILFIDFDTNAKSLRQLMLLFEKGDFENLWVCVVSEADHIAGIKRHKNIIRLDEEFDVEEAIEVLENQVSMTGKKPVEDEPEPVLEFETAEKEAVEPKKPPRPQNLENISERVLLVEDNEVNLKVAQKLIDYIGYPFDVAENGMVALEKAKKRRYRMILMDCQMPVMDGYFCTKRIRKYEDDNALNHTPIIAMTANAMLGDKEKCIEAGMDDYMSKPLNRYILEKTLKQWDPLSHKIKASAGTGAEDYKIQPEPEPAAEEPAINQKWLSLEVLEELKEFMGDDIGSLIDMFLQETPQIIKKMDEHVMAKDFEDIKQLAHTLKSTSANIGAKGLNHFCKQLEQAAIKEEGALLSQVQMKLRKAYQLSAQELKKYQSL